MTTTGASNQRSRTMTTNITKSAKTAVATAKVKTTTPAATIGVDETIRTGATTNTMTNRRTTANATAT